MRLEYIKIRGILDIFNLIQHQPIYMSILGYHKNFLPPLVSLTREELISMPVNSLMTEVFH